MWASTNSCERGICHVVVTLLDSTGINICTGSMTGLVFFRMNNSEKKGPVAKSGREQVAATIKVAKHLRHPDRLADKGYHLNNWVEASLCSKIA